MPSIEERQRFAEKHFRSKEGRPFSLKGRAWVIREFWHAADGWRFVANDTEKLCDDCKDKAGKIATELFVEDKKASKVWWGLNDKLRRHAAAKGDECRGLSLRPILVTILNLPRREGKTFNVVAWILLTLFLSLRRFVLFVASAGDQTERLFEQNFKPIIDQDEDLTDACQMIGNRLIVPSTRSQLEVAKTTSHKSITGGGFSHIVLEEARDLEPRTVAAAVLSIRDQNGYECPRGHEMKPGIGGEFAKHKCGTCGDVMVPWYPRIIIPSSSGIVEHEERDWFNQLIELVKEKAPWAYHLYSTEVSSNPAVDKGITAALAEGFGEVPALKTFMDVELHNRPRRQGEDFVTDADLRRVSSAEIQNLVGSRLQCVAFLDTSWSSELTSLMVCGWDPQRSSDPWGCLEVLHWRIWEPKASKLGVIDDKAVRAHLAQVLPLFPNLRKLLVDNRGTVSWAKDLVIWANKEHARTWGRLVFGFHKRHQEGERQGQRLPGVWGGEDDRALGWQVLETRIVTGSSAIMIPSKEVLPQLHKELLGVTRVARPDGGYEIRDRARKKRHADVAESLAGCCFLAYLEQTSSRRANLTAFVEGEKKDIGREFRPTMGGLTENGF